jgi:hypothetical protein
VVTDIKCNSPLYIGVPLQEVSANNERKIDNKTANC